MSNRNSLPIGLVSGNLKLASDPAIRNWVFFIFRFYIMTVLGAIILIALTIVRALKRSGQNNLDVVYFKS